MYVNHEENVRYYRSDGSAPCDCAYCRNYVARIEAAYPEVCGRLRSMDVDPLRPFELFLPFEREDGRLEYPVCQYIVFGNCEDFYEYNLDGMIFGKALSHPCTQIEGKEHFVMDFGPVILEAFPDEEALSQ